jgi:hypothetical protein
VKTAHPTNNDSAHNRYDYLATEREVYLKRARDCAALTIPSLFPPERGDDGDLPQPYHSVGARGTNNLASKLLLAILPPGSAFFRLRMKESVVEELEQADPENDGLRATLEEALARAEKRVTNAVEAAGARIVLYEALRQLVVAGNVLLNVGKQGALRMFRLDSYVVVRDGEGSILEIVVKETLDRQTVPESVKQVMTAVAPKEHANDPDPNDVDVYTRIRRVGRRWEEHQEVDGQIVPGSHGKYPLKKLPWLALRFSRMPGEHYGRSHAEELLGDLSALDGLCKALIDFAGVASRIIFLLRDGSVTSIDDINNALSGEVIIGDKDEIGALQLDKYADFRVVADSADKIEGRLSAGFLLNTAVQRQAERVTAEEVRYVANELEQALGGIYSVLAQELQRPLAELLMAQLTRDGLFPRLPEGSVDPEIVTGLEALGRSSDAVRLQGALAVLAANLGPAAVAQYINPTEVISRVLTSYGVETKGLVRSEAEVQQMQQQAMQAELVGKLGPEAIRQQAAMSGATPQE